MDCVGSVKGFLPQEGPEAGAALVDAGEGPIKELPDELIQGIFHFLSDEDLGRAQAVCRLWNQVATSMVSSFGVFLSQTKIGRLSEGQRLQLATISRAGSMYFGARRQVVRVLGGLELGVVAMLSRASIDQVKFFSRFINRCLLERLMAIANTIPNPFTKSLTVCDIAKQFAAIGEIERALEVATGMDDAHSKSLVLCEISSLLMAKEEIDGASAVINDALTVANTIRELIPPEALYQIARQLAAMGKNDQAGKVIDKALLVTNKIVDEFLKSRFLCKIAPQLVVIGQIDRALEIANGIFDEYQKVLALCEVASQLVTEGKNDQAGEVISDAQTIANTITQEDELPLALYEIAEKLAAIGKDDQAGEMIDEAFRIANTILDEYKKANALYELAKKLVALGKNDQARQVVDDALTVANTIPSEYRKPWVLIDIAKILATIGNNDQARQALSDALAVASMIDYNTFQSDVFCRTAIQLVAMREIEEASRVANMIPNLEVKIKALLAIAFDR